MGRQSPPPPPPGWIGFLVLLLWLGRVHGQSSSSIAPTTTSTRCLLPRGGGATTTTTTTTTLKGARPSTGGNGSRHQWQHHPFLPKLPRPTAAVPSTDALAPSNLPRRIASWTRRIRERLAADLEKRREKEAREARKQLQRHERWRRAEQQPLPEAREDEPPVPSHNNNNNNNNEDNTPASLLPNQPSDRTKPTASTNMVKIGLMTILLAEALDRIGVFSSEASPGMLLRARLVEFWDSDVRRAVRKAQTALEGLWFGYLWRWIRKVRQWVLSERELWFGSNLPSWRFLDAAAAAYSERLASSTSTTTFTKVAFGLGTAGGMLVTPPLVSGVALAWKPVVVLLGLAEANHSCRVRGKPSVFRWLGDTPGTLGWLLDDLLENCRAGIRRAAATGRQWWCDGDDERTRDAVAMELMGGAPRRRKRWLSHSDESSAYSLGIRGYTPEAREAIDVRRLRATAQRGFLVGCAIGLVRRGNRGLE